MIRQTLGLFSMALAGLAQIPGQYPPGQLPGQYPPRPGASGPTLPSGRQPQTDKGAKNTSLVTTTAGILRRVLPNQLVIEAGDHRVIWYQFSSQLTVRKDGRDAELNSFARGDSLSVDSSEDEQGILTAVSVSWKKTATPEDRSLAAKDWDLPRPPAAVRASTSASSPVREPGDERPVIRRKDSSPVPEAGPNKEQPKEVAIAELPEDIRPTTVMRPPDPKPEADDPGPPALRRGVPVPRRAESVESSPTPPSVVAATAAKPSPASSAPAQPPTPVKPPPPAPEDSVIVKAREAAEAYADTLPNFFVQQFTTRYVSEGKSDWRAMDIVSADVAYEDGTESYKNIKVGNKTVKQSMDEIGGAHSTGEFATILQALFENSGTVFRRKGQDTIRNRSSWIYTFEVSREFSHWRVESPAQLYVPAIRGSIWIDRETSRVLRIEQQGRDLPRLFPFDTVETTTDYDFVRLGATGPFLLPVEAEVLTCIRGTSTCSRNKIEFRNYRKFGADTSITFDDRQ